nr:reverse transcriptase domain-containing protein [Tanacetum cinerariifolium]
RPKRKNVARAYTAGSGEKKAYTRNLPYCYKCKLHHIRSCTVKCGNCKRNQNRGNQVGNREAEEKAYALGGGEVNQDPNSLRSLGHRTIPLLHSWNVEIVYQF